MNDLSFLIWMIPAIPIIAVVDYFVYKSAMENEIKVHGVTWKLWVIPTFLELMMFFAGYGIAKITS
jgi:hypothetical protein